jgi:hypothetical protein
MQAQSSVCNMCRIPFSRMPSEAVFVEGVSITVVFPSKLHLSSLYHFCDIVFVDAFAAFLSRLPPSTLPPHRPEAPPFFEVAFSAAASPRMFPWRLRPPLLSSRLLFPSMQIRSRLNSSTSARLRPSSCFLKVLSSRMPPSMAYASCRLLRGGLRNFDFPLGTDHLLVHPILR